MAEKRLIDANALMDTIRQHEYSLATKQGSVDYGMFTVGIQQAVDEQPTVDAVEVVRCEYCMHRAIGDDVCIHPNRIGDGYIAVKDDDFCSYGERNGNG